MGVGLTEEMEVQSLIVYWKFSEFIGIKLPYEIIIRFRIKKEAFLIVLDKREVIKIFEGLDVPFFSCFPELKR